MNRGSVWWADVPDLGRRPVVVVSKPLVTRLLAPIVALITARERSRRLPTFVELKPDEVGLPRQSYVLTHELYTVPRSRFDDEPVGELPVGRWLELDRSLRYALDLPG